MTDIKQLCKEINDLRKKETEIKKEIKKKIDEFGRIPNFAIKKRNIISETKRLEEQLKSIKIMSRMDHKIITNILEAFDIGEIYSLYEKIKVLKSRLSARYDFLTSANCRSRRNRNSIYRIHYEIEMRRLMEISNDII